MTENPQDQPAEGGQPQYSNQHSNQHSNQPPPPPQDQAASSGYTQQAPVSPSDARMWAMFAHLGGIFFSFVAPLVIYLIYKDRDPFVRRHAAQSLNFQLILLITYFTSFILMIVIIGIFTFLAAAICGLIFPIIASIAANKGEEYTYPYVPQMVT